MPKIISLAITLLLSSTAGATQIAPHRQTPPDLADRDVTFAVETELRVDAAVPASRIAVDTEDGIVTLRGGVDDMLARERAADVALAVRGVRAVVNQIAVQPTPRSDEDIRRDVQEALRSDAATDAYDVSVEVHDARVTLTGEVGSWQERALVERVSKSVNGVAAVEDRITTAPPDIRDDETIHTDIERAFDWDKFIDASLVEVAVHDGAVVLTGLVGSGIEQSRAEGLVWSLPGVRSVDVSGLRVDARAHDRRLRDPRVAVRTDDDIQGAVRRALLRDPRVSSFRIDVTTADGDVTLRGEVDNVAARRAAVQDARNTVGVSLVYDRLTVRSADSRGDARLADAVRRALARDPAVERYDVAVSAHGGTVYLRGTVDSFVEKRQAEDAAARVNGVEAIRNWIAVSGPRLPLASRPYLGDPDRSLYPWYASRGQPAWPSKDDARLARDVDAQLRWSPYVERDDIDVTVDNGVVTLEGEVDTEWEREAAAENAVEGGALRVVNHLRVAGS